MRLRLQRRTWAAAGAAFAACVTFSTTATAAAPGQPHLTVPANAASPAVDRHSVVYTAPITIPAGAVGSGGAACPAGTVVTGGGESNSSVGGVTLHDTYASSNTSWAVFVTNTSSADATFVVYAVCWSGITNYQQLTTAWQGDSRYAGGPAWCPDGLQRLGGGGWYDPPFDGWIDSGPGGDGWFFSLTINRSVAGTSQVICGTGMANIQLATGGSPIGAGQEGVAVAACPDATYVLSGGIGTAPGSRPSRPTDSYPDDETWRDYAYNETDGTTNVAVDLICGA